MIKTPKARKTIWDVDLRFLGALVPAGFGMGFEFFFFFVF
jgi:hypothetical protein